MWMVYWIYQGSHGNIVSVVTRISAGQPRIWILVGTEIFSCPEHSHWPWGPPRLLFTGFWGSLLEIKQPGCEVKHLLRRLISGAIPLLPHGQGQLWFLLSFFSIVDRRRIPKQILQYEPWDRRSGGHPAKGWLETVTDSLVLTRVGRWWGSSNASVILVIQVNE